MNAKLDIIRNTHRSVVRPVFLTRTHKEPHPRGHRAYLDITPDRREPIDLSDKPRGGRWS